jgi:hypothetical protein
VAVAVAGCAAGGGAAVRRLLPKDLNPKLREQVDAALGGDIGGASGPAAGRDCCCWFCLRSHRVLARGRRQ